MNPRKTPVQARARATHDAILEAAAQVISAGGLVGYNTNAVAERAGVSIGSLYQYFPNKDALMVALIHRQQAQQLHNLQSAVALLRDTGLEATVRLLVRSAMQHHRENALLASAIDHEEARLPIADMLDDYLRQGGGLIASLFEQHRKAIGVIDPERAARTIPALVRAIVDSWANRTPPQLDIAEDEAVKAVLGYLRNGAQL